MRGLVSALLVLLLLAAVTACGAPSRPKAKGPVRKTKIVTTAPPAQGTTSPTTPAGGGSEGATSLWPSQPIDSSQPIPPLQPPAHHGPVNGCDPFTISPAGPFNMCLASSVPKFWCCSASYDNWSGIVAGTTVDLKGAVQVDPSTSKPLAPDVVVIDPDGTKTLIPVAADGAFAKEVSFPTVGEYQLGVLYGGKPIETSPFDVAWDYVIPNGAPTVSSLFPDSSRVWPAYDVFLAVPVGQTTTYTIQAVDAAGTPQPGVVLGFYGPITDAQGDATLTISPPQEVAYSPPDALAPNLFTQSYVDITGADGGLTGFPTSPGVSAPTVRRVVRGGTASYDTVDFLLALNDGFTTTGTSPSVDWNATSGTLTITDSGPGTAARLVAATGEVDVGVWQDSAWTWKPFGTTSPVVTGGQVYLGVTDLVTLLNAFAWAAPDGRGGLLFSDAYIP